MNENSPFLILEQACEEALDWVTQRIGYAGLQVIRTFDLHNIRSQPDLASASCTCPHHGTEQCDCQMVVLLVYGQGHQPLSMVAHSHHGQTWFSVVNTPQQRADPQIEATLRRVLLPVTGANFGIV